MRNRKLGRLIRRNRFVGKTVNDLTRTEIFPALIGYMFFESTPFYAWIKSNTCKSHLEIEDLQLRIMVIAIWHRKYKRLYHSHLIRKGRIKQRTH